MQHQLWLPHAPRRICKIWIHPDSGTRTVRVWPTTPRQYAIHAHANHNHIYNNYDTHTDRYHVGLLLVQSKHDLSGYRVRRRYFGWYDARTGWRCGLISKKSFKHSHCRTNIISLTLLIKFSENLKTIQATATIQSTLYGLTFGTGMFQANVAIIAFAESVQVNLGCLLIGRMLHAGNPLSSSKQRDYF